MSKTLKETLNSLGFNDDTIKRFEHRVFEKVKADANLGNEKHASKELQDALNAFATKPDNQSLGNLLILTGQAVETDNLCDNCLLTIFETIGETQARRHLAEALGVPVNAVRVL